MSLFNRRPADTRTKEDLEGIWCNQRLDVGQFNFGQVKTCLIAVAFPTSPMFGGRSLLPARVDGPSARAMLKQAIGGTISNDELVQRVFGIGSFVEYVDQLDEITMSNRSVTPEWMLEELAVSEVTQDWRSAVQRGKPHPHIYELLDDLGARKARHSRADVRFHRGGITSSLWLDAARAGFCATVYPFAPIDSSFGWPKTEHQDPFVIGHALFRRVTASHPLEILPDEINDLLDTIIGDLVAGAERRHGRLPATECRPAKFDGATPYVVSLSEAAIAGAMLGVIGVDSSACRVYAGSPKRLLDPDEHRWPDGPNR